ncbi:MAG: inorganic pyrophosphatase [Anaerolineae bacterium]|nr:inorganic pyrophosphatase [Anaerolineae bacterium]
MGDDFWLFLDALVAISSITIDRPAGTRHPRYPDFVYPLDYGHLDDTRTMDGEGIDVWIGSLPDREVVAVIGTVDRLKRETELKILLGCTPQEAQLALQSHNRGGQAAILIPRPRPR